MTPPPIIENALDKAKNKVIVVLWGGAIAFLLGIAALLFLAGCQALVDSG